ncbi:MAG TPA: chemotaxis protein CheW [Polyangiales bacterium]|nr:chemotaxis protein CheW [Polyangiales bacterium]
MKTASSTSREVANTPPLRNEIESLLFELSTQRFALPLDDIAEVVRAVAVRTLPKAPAITLGIIDVRGEIVPVLDVRSRFGLPRKAVEPSDHFLIARVGSRRVALHVDRAAGVAMLAVLPLTAADNLAASLAHVAGIAATADGLVLIQDLSAFLSQAEAEQLEAALPEEPAAE